MSNITSNLRKHWGKTGGRPRIHLNVVEKQKAYRLRKNQLKLDLLRKNELTKPFNERIAWILNNETYRIVKFRKSLKK